MNRHARALLFAAILPVLIGAAMWSQHTESFQTSGDTPQAPESQMAKAELQVLDAEPQVVSAEPQVIADPAPPAPPPDFESELARLRRDLDLAISLLEKSFGAPIELENVRTTPVTLTAYSSTPDQCDSTPHITASNKPVRHGVIAVSNDLMKELGIGFGQRVLIPGHGVFVVQDKMNPRWHRRVDIWHDDREAARLFGIKKGTLLWIARSQTGPGNGKKNV